MADAAGAAGATRQEDDLVAIAREHIGGAHGLTPAQSARLRGATKAEIESDVQEMRRELGLPPLDERERDASGRFAGTGEGADFNRLIRERSGRR